MMLAGGHLIYFGDNVRVVYLGNTKSGNNEDIKKFYIEGGPVIPIHWEFVAKIQKGGTKMVTTCMSAQTKSPTVAIYKSLPRLPDC
jgi:hypothetical protein